MCLLELVRRHRAHRHGAQARHDSIVAPGCRAVLVARQQHRAREAPDDTDHHDGGGPEHRRAAREIEQRHERLFLLCLGLTAPGERCGGDADGCAGRRRSGRDVANVPQRRYRQCVVETALVPEVGLRATDAAVAGLDRKARPAVPLDGRAGVVGDRALAAELEQAPALARALVIEGLGELPAFVERPAIAAIVNALAVEGPRATEVIEIRYLAEGEVLRQHAGDHDRNGRATRDVDDRLVLDEVADRHRARGIRVARPECRRRPHRCRWRRSPLRPWRLPSACRGC